MSPTQRHGPLRGLRVIEFGGIGPGPLCGMLLADLGAEVLLIERAGPQEIGIARQRRHELAHRGKASLVLDLKQVAQRDLALELAARADVLIEGFRPGTMERLGLGPQAWMAGNAGLIYGRVTGYGQDGPLAARAGHDLNYIALSGVLHAIGRAGQPPTPPLNLVGDYAGGSMLLALGILAAIVERARSGQGQVVDAAMVEGAALLMAPWFGMLAAGLVNGARGENLLDSGAPFYDVYRCQDGQYLAFAAVEPKFRAVFAQRTGFDQAALLDADRSRWPALREALAALFAQRTRDAWCALLQDCDACVTPVLPPASAAAHPHNAARQVYVQAGGIAQPGPAPRFSRTPADAPGLPPEPGQGGDSLTAAWGITENRLLEAGVTGTRAHHRGMHAACRGRHPAL
ncbi:CaiB/BaiF CoA-transferase family protein [Bordetella bronchiseptica]|uniref:CaiB/BaiF CoA transferase family protein n=1 Tax=Bordetella bronchiseptica TaxID=518 RepID=UPI003F749769